MNKMPSSPRFCTVLGTSLGLAKAAQKNQITSAAQRMASSIGMMKWNEPMLKIGSNWKLFGYPGAGYPQPEPRWQPAATGTRDVKVTLDSLSLRVAWTARAAPVSRGVRAAVARGGVGQDRPYR